MKIAYTMTAGKGDTDVLLAKVAQRLSASGWRTSGVVQINSEACDDHRCDMDVKVLPDGATIRISQTLGRMSRGCRLNPSALEQAVADSQVQLAKGADVLIVNKFGKHEAEGRGFRALIAEAMVLDVPVIVGVNGQNLDALLEFSEGFATKVIPDVGAIVAWLDELKSEICVA